MSLLLEALKKAEKAKEDAQRRAKEDKGGVELGLAENATPPREGTGGVRTRDQLPDISRPLEILSDDMATSEPGGRTEPGLALEDETPARTGAAATSAEPAPMDASSRRRGAPRDRRAGSSSADPQAGERAAARKVFEAKFKEPDPRLPFYITLGVLGAFAIGTLAYFWVQLRPPPALVNTSPQRPPDEQPVPLAQTAPPPAPPSATTASIPGLPPIGGAPAPAQAAPAPSPGATPPPAPLAAQAPAARASPAPSARPRKPAASEPAARPRGAAAPAPRPAPAGEALASSRPAPQIDPRIEVAYGAYQAGKIGVAREGYQAVLRDEPANRDALLGLAAVEMRSQRYEAAESHYRRLLQANPRDPHAQAGMLALRSEQLDPVLAESRIKTLLASDPEATVLYFTLGNQYAQQGRWAEAQQAYFKALAADPENADFAYNLAVSLDHLRQSKLALEHYRRALALAQQRSASFDADAARRRVLELSR